MVSLNAKKDLACLMEELHDHARCSKPAILNRRVQMDTNLLKEERLQKITGVLGTHTISERQSR